MSAVVTASLLADKPRRRHEDEFALQREVCRFLRWALPADAEYFSVPNGGLRHRKIAAKLAATGLRAGVPDLCVVWRGDAIFIELKTAHGVLSDAQRLMANKLRYCGCQVLVCRSVLCVESSLIELGVPLRASVS